MPSHPRRSSLPRPTPQRGSATAALLGAAGAVVVLGAVLVGVTPVLEPWSFADAAVTSRFLPVVDVAATGQPVTGSHDLATGTPTSVVLTSQRGVAGSRLRLSGEGFEAGERVVIRFDAFEMALVTANGRGHLDDVVVVVPADVAAFAPASFTISATGISSSRGAEATFHLTG